MKLILNSLLLLSIFQLGCTKKSNNNFDGYKLIKTEQVGNHRQRSCTNGA